MGAKTTQGTDAGTPASRSEGKADPASKEGQNMGTPRKSRRETSVAPKPAQDPELKDYVSKLLTQDCSSSLKANTL